MQRWGEYNNYGLLDREYQEHSGAKGGNTPYVGYNYDESAVGGELENGLRPTSLRYPNGRLVHYTYGSTDSAADVLNRLDAISDDSSGSPGDVLASYTYLGLGTVVIQDYEEPDVKLDLFGGSSGTYAGFDQFDRIVDQRWYDYGSSTDVDRYKYGYDRASNRLWKENVVAANNGKDFDEFYTYDGLHRLKNFDRGDLNAGKTAITGTPANEEDWTLDPLGNWSNFVQKTSGTTDLNQSRIVNEVNEITDITETVGPSWITPAFDRNGNMTTVPKPADPTVAFTCTYDAWNRMVKVEEGVTTVGEYAYDAFTRRITKDVNSTVRHLLYSSEWQALEQRLDVSSNAERQYVWGPQYVDQLILRDRDFEASGTLEERLYALQDTNWNVTANVDVYSMVVERYRYEPYGAIEFLDELFAHITSGSDSVYAFTGREVDAETLFYCYRVRTYNSALGQFLSRDPKGFQGRQLNWYQYVASSPLRFVDPQGTDVIDIAIPITNAPFGGPVTCWANYKVDADCKNGSIAIDTGSLVLTGLCNFAFPHLTNAITVNAMQDGPGTWYCAGNDINRSGKAQSDCCSPYGKVTTYVKPCVKLSITVFKFGINWGQWWLMVCPCPRKKDCERCIGAQERYQRGPKNWGYKCGGCWSGPKSWDVPFPYIGPEGEVSY